MNQAIQFIDRVEFNASLQRVYFYAQVSGLMVSCYFNTAKEEQAALEHFTLKRFDYEDSAEALIEDEAYSENGEICVEELL